MGTRGRVGNDKSTGAVPAARWHIRSARACASATGSIGWLTTASARDQVASQPSSGRPMISSAGGQL
jgi:hypothetical protein